MATHQNNRRIFAVTLLAIQIIVIVMFGIFVRPRVHSDPTVNTNYYPMYQDVNVMMLIGFGFLMTFIKSHSWSALSYTFFINAVIVQLYILLSGFWQRVFVGGWDNKIFIQQKSFTAASYSVTAILISFGGVLGRVGPLELLIMGLVQIVGYTLNQQIVYGRLRIFDSGGSTTIHTFGAYFGLTVSLILSKAVKQKKKPQTNYNSNIFAMIGTLFLWMYWPSFNAGYYPEQPYQKTVIITNTIISLTGSCLGTFIMTSIVREKFSMEDILNATLAGGVIIGAPCGIFTNPAAALCIGLFGGIVSTLGFKYLQDKLQKWIGLYDTCGIQSLHGIPGVLGGIFSAIAIASYGSDPLTDPTQIGYLSFYPQSSSNLNIYGRTFYQQGGCQIAAIFISMGFGIAFGVVAGYLMRILYAFSPSDFFKDNIYFLGVADQQLPDQQTEGRKMEFDETLEFKFNLSGQPSLQNLSFTPVKKIN